MAADWEFEVLDFFIGIRNDFLTGFGKFLTFLGNGGVLWIALCALLIVIPKTRKIGIYAAVGLAVQALLGEAILKNIIQRERPFVQNPLIDTIIPTPLGKYSFPSGHTSSSFCVSVSVLIQNKKLGIPLLILAVIIALSRLYFCVHFLTDILAGAVLGLTVAIIIYYVLNYVVKRRTLSRQA